MMESLIDIIMLLYHLNVFSILFNLKYFIQEDSVFGSAG
jgi:hypothetical protein